MSLQIAAAASKLSPLRPKVGAAITKNGKVLGLGFNKRGSSRLSRAIYSRHAEISAIIAAGDCRGATIHVYRAHGKTGEPLLSKPCVDCAEAIEIAGIRRVIYSQ